MHESHDIEKWGPPRSSKPASFLKTVKTAFVFAIFAVVLYLTVSGVTMCPCCKCAPGSNCLSGVLLSM